MRYDIILAEEAIEDLKRSRGTISINWGRLPKSYGL